MKTCNKGMKCLIVVIFCFSHALSEKKSCTELRRHRNWLELRRASSVCGLTGASITPRVMGGRPAVLAEFPWMALITYSCGIRCGGFLITGRHVLTAGHCCEVSWLATGCNVTGVTLGERDLETNVDCYRGQCAPEPIHVPVEKVALYKGFNMSTSVDHDICLLTLDRTIKSSPFVNPICLPDECTWKEPDYKWDQLKIAGWGFEEDNPARGHAVLQTLDMMAVPHRICAPLWEAGYGLPVTEERQLCAGMELGKDKCKGDSGGPLMYQAPDRMVAVGIVSFGQNCSHNDSVQIPGVYTRLSHYMPWILDNL